MPSSWRAALFPATVIVTVAVALAGIGVLATRGDRPPGVEIFLPTPTATPELQAYITGAVVSPGIHTIDTDFRITDLIRASGGGTSDADLSRINLSQRIGDGAHIHVPAFGEPLPPSVQEAIATINVNTASGEELQILKGIGPALALGIVEHREANGPYLRLEDLLMVSRIGPATLEGFRSQAMVR